MCIDGLQPPWFRGRWPLCPSRLSNRVSLVVHAHALRLVTWLCSKSLSHDYLSSYSLPCYNHNLSGLSRNYAIYRAFAETMQLIGLCRTTRLKACLRPNHGLTTSNPPYRHTSLYGMTRTTITTYHNLHLVEPLSFITSVTYYCRIGGVKCIGPSILPFLQFLFDCNERGSD